MHHLSSLKARDKFLPLGDPLTHQRQISVIGEGSNRRFAVLYSENRDDLASFPEDLEIFALPAPGTDEMRMLDILVNVVSFILQNSARGRLSFDKLKSEAMEKVGIDTSFVEPAIRLLLSEGLLTASHPSARNGSVMIELSAEGRRIEQVRTHATSIASELKERSQQLGRLIGHGPTIGANKEELLRSFLEQRLPRRYHVATGFVQDFDRQIDVLIYDQIDYAPLFRAGNLVVVPREAVRAAIEVKSTLDRANIRNALQQITECARPRWPSPPIFKGIFAFKGASAATLVDEWKTFHRLPSDDPDDESLLVPVTDIYTMPDAICVLDKTFLMSTYADETEPRPVIEEYGSHAGRPLQAAMFFDMLDRYLRYPREKPILNIPLAPYYYVDIAVRAVHPLYETGALASYLEAADNHRLVHERDTLTRWTETGPWDPRDPIGLEDPAILS